MIALAEMWRCEGCGLVWEGVSPPSKCDMCDHEYFENMQDLENEGEAWREALH